LDRRVVITGLGCLSPAGIGAQALADAVRRGASAVRAPTRFDAAACPDRAAGEVPDFDPTAGIRKDQSRYIKKNIKVMARDIQLAVAAANLAVLDCGLPLGDFKAKEPVLPTIDHTRFGIIFGTNFIPTELEDLSVPIQAAREDGRFSLKGWGERGIPEMFPLWLLKFLPNMHACHTSVLWDAQGPNNSLTCSDAGGLLALDECVRILKRGSADWMLAGGAESRVNPITFVRYTLLGRMANVGADPPAGRSPTAGEGPAVAGRPFDLGGTGEVAAEGAACLMIESMDVAEARNARIAGEILGTGSSTTTAGVNTCDPDGRAVATAIRAALADAGLEPGDLGVVLAHAAGLAEHDRSEAAGLADALGHAATTIPVISMKGVTGNMGAASGLADLAAALIFLKEGQVPPIVNCDQPDPEVALNLVTGDPQPLARDLILVTTNAIGGQAVAAVVKMNR